MLNMGRPLSATEIEEHGVDSHLIPLRLSTGKKTLQMPFGKEIDAENLPRLQSTL